MWLILGFAINVELTRDAQFRRLVRSICIDIETPRFADVANSRNFLALHVAQFIYREYG